MKLYVHVHTHYTIYVPFSKLGMAYPSVALAGAGHPDEPLTKVVSLDRICSS